MRAINGIFVLFFASVLPVHALPFELRPGLDSVRLDRYADIFEDPAGTQTIIDADSPAMRERFKPGGTDNLNFGFSNSVYWCRVTLLNPGPSPIDGIFEIAYPHLEYAGFYQRSDSRFTLEEGGYRNPPPGDGISSENTVFKVKVPPGESTYYFRLRTDNAFLSPLYFYTEAAFHAHQKTVWLFYAFGFGILLAIFLYNLLIFSSLKDATSFVYLLYIAGWMAELAVFSGFASNFIWPQWGLWSSYSIPLTAVAVQAIGAWFARLFLSTRVNAPRVDRLIVAYLWAYIVLTALCFVWPGLTGLHTALVWLTLAYPFLVLAAGVGAYRRKLHAAIPFLAAWSALIIGMVIFALVQLGAAPYNLFTFHAVDIGAVLLCIFMPMAIRDKINQMRRDKEEAQLKALESEHMAREVLKRANEELEDKVAERTMLFRKEKERAEDATNVKDKFLSLVSHDLRGPLGNVLLLLDLLERSGAKAQTDERRRELTARAKNNIEALVEMIDQLLDISRFRTGRVALRKLHLRADALAEDALEMYRDLAREKGITLRSNVPKDIRILADPILTSEVVKNLVSNAIKFCRNGDTITVSAEGGRILVVEDTGVGVAPAIMADIFKPEVKTSTVGTAGEQGSGLGLPYSREIMLAHGGDLRVESRPGKGARFFMEFPEIPSVIAVSDRQGRAGGL